MSELMELKCSLDVLLHVVPTTRVHDQMRASTGPVGLDDLARSAVVRCSQRETRGDASLDFIGVTACGHQHLVQPLVLLR
jgi:hypothetical protein